MKKKKPGLIMSRPTLCIGGCHQVGLMPLIGDAWHCQKQGCGKIYPKKFYKIDKRKRRRTWTTET